MVAHIEHIFDYDTRQDKIEMAVAVNADTYLAIGFGARMSGLDIVRFVPTTSTSAAVEDLYVNGYVIPTEDDVFDWEDISV